MGLRKVLEQELSRKPEVGWPCVPLGPQLPKGWLNNGQEQKDRWGK